MNAFGIILSPTELYLLGIFGVLCGLLITHYLAVALNRRKSFDIAATNFRNTVINELKEIYPDPANWPEDRVTGIQFFLNNKFPALQAAVAEFKPFLSKRKQRQLEKAWFIYHSQYYYQYMPIKSGSYVNGELIVTEDTTENYKINFLNNVENLLNFAKHN